MKVISNFHDFYDCMQRYDQDREVIFQRKTEVKAPIKWSMYWSSDRYEGIYVEFCGKLYYGLLYLNHETKVIKEFIWGRDKIDSILLEEFKRTPRYRWNKRDKPTAYDGKIAEAVAQGWKPNKDIAIIVCYLSGKIYYPCLKDLQFQKVIPPQQAWIELSNWFNNIARPLRPIPKVSDSDLLQAKGFDIKTSFRKDKSTKG